MDTTYCVYYGLMSLVLGVFDTILFVERWLHVKYPLFSRHAPMMFNVASFVCILCPAVELASAVLAAAIYMDAQEAEGQLMIPRYAQERREETQGDGSRQTPGGRIDQSFRPFEGRCHHL